MKEQTDRNNEQTDRKSEQTDRKSEQTDRKSEQTDRKSELTDRRKKLQGVLKDLPVVVGIYFLLVAGLTVLRPFYLKSLNRDITLTIVATGEKQESSKSNYVRLSHIAVNGRDINLAQVKIDEGSLWTYDSLNDYLRVYEFEDPQSITVQLKDVHSLKVGMVSEVGSGIAEILIDGEMRERVDLFKKADWDTYWFRYDPSVFVFPERHLWLQILTLFLISFSCFLWNRKHKIPEKVRSACTWTVLCAFLSVLILTGISLIQYDDESRTAEFSPRGSLYFSCSDFPFHSVQPYMARFFDHCSLFGSSVRREQCKASEPGNAASAVGLYDGSGSSGRRREL